MSDTDTAREQAWLEPEAAAPTTVNVELLRDTLDHIETHPQEWDQSDWWCETTACFAGHAALLAGADLVDEATQKVTYDGKRMHISDAAQLALRLSDREAVRLFAGSNDLGDLRRIVAELAKARASYRVDAVDTIRKTGGA